MYTSGIIIIGKTEYVIAHLSKQLFDRNDKTHYYIALAGAIWKSTGRIECNIARTQTTESVFMAVEDGLIGKHGDTL